MSAAEARLRSVIKRRATPGPKLRVPGGQGIKQGTAETALSTCGRALCVVATCLTAFSSSTLLKMKPKRSSHLCSGVERVVL